MSTRTLINIKAGDRIWVKHDHAQIICKVLKLTPTQIVTDWPWGKDPARFYRGRQRRHGSEPSYRKIGYCGWNGSEILSIASVAECEKYDAAQQAKKAQAEVETKARQEREARRKALDEIFGRRMASVYESHHIEGVEWTVQIHLTTQGVMKLGALIEALTDTELPSWKQSE